MRLPEVIVGSGPATGFRMELHLPATDDVSAAGVTEGALRVSVCGHPVWFGRGDHGFTWTWVELVEFWGQVWFWMTREQLPPWIGRPFSISHIESMIGLDGFAETHDLAEGVQGAVLPSIWIVPDKQGCWVVTAEESHVVSLADVLDTFNTVGEALVSRLRVVDDHRAVDAVHAWQHRERNP